MLGSYTAAQTGPHLKKFVEDGGTILAVGRSSTSLAQLVGVPVDNHLVERSADGSVRPVPAEKYYVPGSVLRMAVDNTAPIAHGLDDHVDVLFDNSPVFALGPQAMLKGVRPVAWFDTAAPLRSGWAFGQGYLNGGVAGRRCRRRQGPAVHVRAGNHVPRAAARHVQVPVQRNLSRREVWSCRHDDRGDQETEIGGRRRIEERCLSRSIHLLSSDSCLLLTARGRDR